MYRNVAGLKRTSGDQIDYAQIAVLSYLLVLIGKFLEFIVVLGKYQEQQKNKLIR